MLSLKLRIDSFRDAVVGGELTYGASISQRKRENLAAVQEFPSGIVQVRITPSVAQRYGTLKAVLVEEYGPRERAKEKRRGRAGSAGGAGRG